MEQLIGFYRACATMLNARIEHVFKSTDLSSRLVESIQNDFKVCLKIFIPSWFMKSFGLSQVFTLQIESMDVNDN